MDKTEIRLSCTDQDQTVTLRCCEEHYPIEWDRIPVGGELTNSGWAEKIDITHILKVMEYSC